MKEKNIKYLFLGGSYDGQWLEGFGKKDRIQLPTPEKQLVSDEPPPEFIQVKVENYILDLFMCKDKRWYIYRHESLAMEDIFPMLINNYRPKEM